MAVFGDWYQVSILGSGSSGSPPTTGPTLIGGSDGTNLRTIKTDSSGNMKVTGVETVGTPTAGAPILMGGFDGTNVRLMTTDASGNQMNVGNVAAAATDSGNPIKIGGKGNSSTPTAVAIGQRTDLWTTLNGGAIVAPLSTNAVADNATSTTILRMQAYNGADGGLSVGTSIFNGTSWDRQRNNVDTAALVTLAAQAAGSGNSADQTNYNGRGVQLGVNITVAAAGGSLTVTIQGKDVASGTYYTLLTFTSGVAATGFTLQTVYPGCIAVANSVANLPLPRIWRVAWTVNVNNITATIGASVIL